MCVACLTFSALSLFAPVADTPQPVTLQQGTVREIVVTQAPRMSVAQETQAAIATLLQKLPAGSDLQLLRQGLETLQVRLNHAQSDAEADAIIDQELAALEKRVLAAPTAEQMIAALRAIVLGDETLQSSKATFLIGSGKHWGWLS